MIHTHTRTHWSGYTEHECVREYHYNRRIAILARPTIIYVVCTFDKNKFPPHHRYQLPSSRKQVPYAKCVNEKVMVDVEFKQGSLQKRQDREFLDSIEIDRAYLLRNT